MPKANDRQQMTKNAPKRMKRWFFKHLSHRINAMLIAMILLSIAFSVVIAIYFVREESTSAYRVSVQKQLGLVDTALSQYIDHIRYNTQMISEMPLLKQIDHRITSYIDKSGPNGLVPMEPWKSNAFEQEAYQLLGVIQNNHPSIKNTSFGVEVNGGFLKYPAQPRFDGYDARERSWYKLAIEHPEKVMVKGIYTTSTNEKVILSVRTIHNAKREVIGVVSVDFDLRVLSQTIDDVKIGDEGYVVLVDAEGIVLAHPKQDKGIGNHPKSTSYVGLSLDELGFGVAVSKFEKNSRPKPGRYQVKIDNMPMTIELIPSKEKEIGLFYLVVIPSEAFSRSALRIAFQLLISTLPLSILASILGAQMTGRIVKPIQKLKEWSEEITAGKLDERIDLDRVDELGQLANQFNHMAISLESARSHLEEQVIERTTELTDTNSALRVANQELTSTMELLNETQQKLLRSEKLAGLSTMVAGIAHEINTPLGIAITMISYLEMAQNEEPIQRSVLIEITEVLNRNLKRVNQLVERFKQVAVDQASEVKRAFDLNMFFVEQMELQKFDTRLRQINVEWNCPNDLIIASYPGTMGTIFSQLIENAYTHAYHGSGKVVLSAALDPSDKMLTISYRDYGCGLDEVTKARLFEPFYTTNRMEGATGLGMFVVYNSITLQLGGTISVVSELGQGLELEIRIPV